MIYIAKNIDVDKFLKELDKMEEREMYAQEKEISNAESYHEGYKRALWNIKEMFYCSNYEKKEEIKGKEGE